MRLKIYQYLPMSLCRVVLAFCFGCSRSHSRFAPECIGSVDKCRDYSSRMANGACVGGAEFCNGGMGSFFRIVIFAALALGSASEAFSQWDPPEGWVKFDGVEASVSSVGDKGADYRVTLIGGTIPGGPQNNITTSGFINGDSSEVHEWRPATGIVVYIETEHDEADTEELASMGGVFGPEADAEAHGYYDPSIYPGTPSTRYHEEVIEVTNDFEFQEIWNRSASAESMPNEANGSWGWDDASGSEAGHWESSGSVNKTRTGGVNVDGATVTFSQDYVWRELRGADDSGSSFVQGNGEFRRIYRYIEEGEPETVPGSPSLGRLEFDGGPFLVGEEIHFAGSARDPNGDVSEIVIMDRGRNRFGTLGFTVDTSQGTNNEGLYEFVSIDGTISFGNPGVYEYDNATEINNSLRAFARDSRSTDNDNPEEQIPNEPSPWSAPQTLSLTIEENVAPTIDLDITSAGSGFVQFDISAADANQASAGQLASFEYQWAVTGEDWNDANSRNRSLSASGSAVSRSGLVVTSSRIRPGTIWPVTSTCP